MKEQIKLRIATLVGWKSGLQCRAYILRRQQTNSSALFSTEFRARNDAMLDARPLTKRRTHDSPLVANRHVSPYAAYRIVWGIHTRYSKAQCATTLAHPIMAVLCMLTVLPMTHDTIHESTQLKPYQETSERNSWSDRGESGFRCVQSSKVRAYCFRFRLRSREIRTKAPAIKAQIRFQWTRAARATLWLCIVIPYSDIAIREFQ